MKQQHNKQYQPGPDNSIQRSYSKWSKMEQDSPLIKTHFDIQKQRDRINAPDFDKLIANTSHHNPAGQSSPIVDFSLNRIILATTTIAAMLLFTTIVFFQFRVGNHSAFTETDYLVAESLTGIYYEPTSALLNYYSLGSGQEEYLEESDYAVTEITEEEYSEFTETTAFSSRSLLLSYWSSPSDSLLDYPVWQEEEFIEVDKNTL